MALIRGRKRCELRIASSDPTLCDLDPGLVPSQAEQDRVQNQPASYKVRGRPESALRFEPSQGRNRGSIPLGSAKDNNALANSRRVRRIRVEYTPANDGAR